MSRNQAQPAHVVVGREPERAALARFCESIEAGACALVLSGGAGVGKTALWSLGVREAALAFRVLTCHPGELGTKVSYSGLSELLDGLESEVALLPAELSHALRQALRLEPVSQGGTDHASVALAVASVLRNAAAQPLVLAIDDLQWLDPSSSRVLGFALRRLTDHPVGVLASQRRGPSRRPRQ
jgi:AAA ATPase domain